MKVQDPNYGQQEADVQRKGVCYLYEFDFRGIKYRWTNWDVPVKFLGETFQPEKVKHSAVDAKQGFSIAAPVIQPVLLWFIHHPVAILKVKVWRVNGHLPTPAENDTYSIFAGHALTFAFKEGLASISFTNQTVDPSLGCPNLVCSKYCNWSLYSHQCGVQRQTLEVRVASIDWLKRAIIVENAVATENYYAYGDLTDTIGQRWQIVSSVASGPFVILHMAEMPYELAMDDMVIVAAGCDKSEDTCRNKFNNIGNFGGPGTRVKPKNLALDGF